MPVTVEDAVVVGEEDKLVTRGECLGNGNIPCPRRPAVALQDDVLDSAVRQ